VENTSEPSRHIIRIEYAGRVFNYRTVGVLLHEGRVLLHRGETEDFWSLPGGRVELCGETAAESLRREMLEELVVEVEVVRLLWLVENFFRYTDREFYEFGMYFLMRLPADAPLLRVEEPFTMTEEGGLLFIFRWFRLEELGSIRLLPSFLVEGLRDLPDSPRHLVEYDDPL
jgi:ADP-ribose pyrophosphatase YjhB (NUDIX family)